MLHVTLCLHGVNFVNSPFAKQACYRARNSYGYVFTALTYLTCGGNLNNINILNRKHINGVKDYQCHAII